MDEDLAERIAELYDASVPDWPGEIDFYQALAAGAAARGQAVLEVACGTGRVAIRLARDGARVVGLDRSPAMLNVARAKSAGLPNLRWVEADMRAFDLGETFGLALIPGHSFQNLLTPEDQLACLVCIRRHLAPGGRLVVHLDHQSLPWLGGLCGDQGGVLKAAQELAHPRTGALIRVSQAWTYTSSTQTATLLSIWEELDAAGQVVDRWERPPLPLHCVFRFEMEHLLARAGFVVEALYGDFLHGELADASSEMVWLAQNGLPGEP